MNLVLSQRTQLSDNLWDYLFTPTAPLRWLSGQFISIKIPGISRPEQAERQFTIASHPGTPYVRIVTRHGQSEFKQTLAAMPEGASVVVSQSPAGTFVWKNPEQAKILCAAGVGVTPFLAMLSDPRTPLDAAPVTLVYGHPQTPLPDQSLLARLTQQHQSFQIITLPDRPTAGSLSELKLHFGDALVYASGIQGATRLMLPPLNLHPHQLITDEFTGYSANEY